MIDFRKAFFIKSVVEKKYFLTDRRQVVFLGRSNVGKSSLINALCDNSKLMYVSKTPGRTTMLNYLDLDSEFYLVDAPGYGFATGNNGTFEKLMLDYFSNVKNVIAVLLCDSRRPFTKDDLGALELLKRFNVPYITVLTKADKLNQKERSLAKKTTKAVAGEGECVFVSVKSKEGLDTLKKDIYSSLIK